MRDTQLVRWLAIGLLLLLALAALGVWSLEGIVRGGTCGHTVEPVTCPAGVLAYGSGAATVLFLAAALYVAFRGDD